MDIRSDSNLPGTNGTLTIYLNGVWIKAKGAVLSQCLCKPPFRGLWRFIGKKDLENRNAASEGVLLCH